MKRKLKVTVTRRRRTVTTGPSDETPGKEITPEEAMSQEVIEALRSAGQQILARLDSSEKEAKN